MQNKPEKHGRKRKAKDGGRKETSWKIKEWHTWRMRGKALPSKWYTSIPEVAYRKRREANKKAFRLHWREEEIERAQEKRA